MITVDSTLAAHLATGGPFLLADLYEVTLQDASVLRWTSADQPVVWGGYTWISDCPVLTRGATRIVIGAEVDTLDVTIAPRSTDTLEGVSFLSAARAGALDGARLVLRRAFLHTDGSVVGAVWRFSGRFADVDMGRTALSVRVNSDLEALAVQLPRATYSPTCLRTLYSTGCGVSRASNTVTGAVGAGSTSASIVCSLAQPAGWWNMGGVAFTSGELMGTKRSLKAYASGALQLFSPLPVAPAVGDTFSIFPGCDKTMATCQNKYSNVVHFRGFPFIPTPETAV